MGGAARRVLAGPLPGPLAIVMAIAIEHRKGVLTGTGAAAPRRDGGFTLIELPATRKRDGSAFTLIELLVVIAIISLLTAIILPSLASVKELARSAVCGTNLHGLGLTMGLYQGDNEDRFWPCALPDYPTGGVTSYFWGTATDPVDHQASPLLKYADYEARSLWCPSMKWGTYVPQGGVNEPTTTYGYNAWCLDPAFWGRMDADGEPMRRKRGIDLGNSSALFVFADSGMHWAPGGVPIFQNSTSLDPVDLGPWGANTTPTTHFRHDGWTNALCADGHAGAFDLEGGSMLQEEYHLGFVGADNVPHYDQE